MGSEMCIRDRLSQPTGPDGTGGGNISESNATRRYTFRIRIPELHSSIPDPCALVTELTGENLSDQAALRIALHPIAISADLAPETRGTNAVASLPKPSLGDIVWVEFEKAPAGGRMGSPIYVGIDQSSESRAESGDAPPNNIGIGEVCESWEGLFASSGQQLGTAGNVTLPPSPGFTPLSTSAIQAANRNYDDSDIPDKSQHSNVLSSLQPDFRPYVKNFLYKCWTQRGIKIRLNSGYRDSTDQQRVRAQWEANGRNGPEPTPGLSYHSLGMAIDFNPTPTQGSSANSMIMSSDPAQIWLDSGVVAIAEECGMYWGGRFRTNYDPIHVDWRGRVAISDRQTFVSAALAAGVAPNQHRLT